MFGVGELIAGVLAIYVGKSGTVASIGGSIAYSGLKTMWSVGNSLWFNHQMAIMKLKQLTEEAEKVSRNNISK